MPKNVKKAISDSGLSLILSLSSESLVKNIWIYYSNHGWKLSQFLIENIQWFHANKSWNAISDSGLSLPSEVL